MNKSLVMTMLMLTSAAVCLAVPATPGFDRYQIIIEKKPFGDVPVAPVETQPVQAINPAQSFAAQYRFTSIVESDDGEIRVGLVDQKTNQSVFLTVGETDKSGIELVSADYKEEEAVLRKGPEMAIMKMSDGAFQPLTPEEQAALSNRSAAPAPTALSGRRTRASSRSPIRTPSPAPVTEKPQLTGDQLWNHLQDYNMEVIRQGLPPLPIPLTEEQDAQLVNEGVLPPQEDP